MNGGRPRESPMQPLWLRAKGAFYPETELKKERDWHRAIGAVRAGLGRLDQGSSLTRAM